MQQLPRVFSRKHLFASFALGAVCALALPKAFLTLLGVSLLCVTAATLSQISHKVC